MLPRDYAYDFLLFCQRNPRPCPLIEVTDVGSPEPVGVAPGADLRTDIPRYRIYKDGVLADEVTDATPYWRDDLVAFLLGCSFTFEWALLEAGIRLWHVEHGKNVAMWKTSMRMPASAGAFHGPMVVSMRPIPSAQLVQGGDGERALSRTPTARRCTSAIRPPSASRTSRKPDWGDAAALRPGRRAGVLGVRRDAAGGGAGQQAAVHDHAQPGAHVHHRPAELLAGGALRAPSAIFSRR